MSNLLRFGILLSGMALLGACSGFGVGKDEPAVVQGPSSQTTVNNQASTAPADTIGMINGVRIDQKTSPDYVRNVYFEYDSSEVRTEFLPLIAAHAKLLNGDRGKQVLLEGHADERGSREYNIALGERRALSVRRLLRANGVNGGQIRVVSYGEERPAVSGSNESAWEKNRRVVLLYDQ